MSGFALRLVLIHIKKAKRNSEVAYTTSVRFRVRLEKLHLF